MPGSIIVDNVEVETTGNQSELSARISTSDTLFEPFRLWYRLPRKWESYVSISGDPFLAALLPLAMKKKLDLKINAPTSERMYFQTDQIMEIISGWFDTMESVEIKADVFSSQVEEKPRVTGCFFTGGVDSFYSVLKNLDFYENESRISHLLYVHGLDIDIHNESLFQSVKSRITAAAHAFELEPLFIKTNLRKLTDRYVRWGQDQHGAALASTGLCLSNLFKHIIIPSSVSYSELFPWGSHPFIDPLWSNEHTRFIHDGNEANRSEKISWQLSESNTALKFLRVCWRNPDNLYNCGECGKCIRTKINLKLAGALEQCKTLDNKIDLEKYAEIIKNSRNERHHLSDMINRRGNTDHNQLQEELKELYSSTEKKQIGLKFREFVKKGYRTLWDT